MFDHRQCLDSGKSVDRHLNLPERSIRRYQPTVEPSDPDKAQTNRSKRCCTDVVRLTKTPDEAKPSSVGPPTLDLGELRSGLCLRRSWHQRHRQKTVGRLNLDPVHLSTETLAVTIEKGMLVKALMQSMTDG